ncbi:lysozyme inhibitor LprI family protein [Klebsiella aerogenes]|uniref:lysozyme inhibitor LprI family protein n=1 Tax=Klebsiella aerogenes TaxID=548 RepID=UPI003CFE9EF2
MTRCLINLFIINMVFTAPGAWAVNCQRATTPLENTICNNVNLNWLDETLSSVYRAMLVHRDATQVHKEYLDWEKSLESCSSDSCIERAYYSGISKIAEAEPGFSWEGRWWNTSASNMSGGVIQFSHSATWSIIADIRIWAGMNKDELTAEARKINGMVLIDNMVDNKQCKVLFIPRKSGALQVYSNTDWGCRLSMPNGAFIDGRYLKSEQDPRPKATLLSLKIFSDQNTDERFRTLVGDDYQKFVDTANVFIYHDDIDNIGATVVSMWVRGAANTRTAIIMYTASNIWAARVEPDEKGKLTFSYFSTLGNDVTKMPQNIAEWKMRYLEQ